MVYKIRAIYHSYCRAVVARQGGVLADAAGEPLRFASEADARAVIAALRAQEGDLPRGEYAPPRYEVVPELRRAMTWPVTGALRELGY